MKKMIVIALLLSVFAVSAFAGTIAKDENRQPLQGAAPDGLLSRILTVASTTIDLTGTLWWGLYSPTACKYRIMPTSAKGAYPQFTIPANQPVSMLINPNTRFINYSGCTSGELSRF